MTGVTNILGRLFQLNPVLGAAIIVLFLLLIWLIWPKISEELDSTPRIGGRAAGLFSGLSRFYFFIFAVSGIFAFFLLLLALSGLVAPYVNKNKLYDVALPARTVHLRPGLAVGQVEALVNQKMNLSPTQLRDYKFSSNDFGADNVYRFIFYKGALDGVEKNKKMNMPSGRSGKRGF